MEKNFQSWLEEQMLNEMSTIFNVVKGKKTIEMKMTVNPDPNRVGDEYFKVYDKVSIGASKKCACIYFRKAEYNDHDLSVYKEPWHMTNDEKKFLIKKLKSSMTFMGTKMTYFQYGIICFNFERNNLPNIEVAFQKTINNLTSKLKYPKLLPFDLEMPDYSKLPD